MRFSAVACVYAISGASGLILQGVWNYHLGLVFGNAAYATAATLAAFFMGLAAGGWLLGKAASRSRRPLALYGLLELGIALSALLFLAGIEFYRSNYPTLVAILGESRSGLAFGKFAFSTSLLLLPTFLMGGTFPALAEFVGHRGLPRQGTLLYSLNTLGAAAGAFLTGFYFLSSFGVRNTYLVAIGLAVSAGIAALLLDRASKQTDSSPKIKVREKRLKPKSSASDLVRSQASLSLRQVSLLAFGSGLLALATEVLWVRMFAQVLQNSVYSFAAILTVFLLALGLGGALAHLLIRRKSGVVPTLSALLASSALGLALTPVIFNLLTDGGQYLGQGATWSEYLGSVFTLVGLIVLPAGTILGTLFPFLLKTSAVDRPGRFVGRLILFNSIGSTAGPLLAGFVMLDMFGLWLSIKVVAVGYAILLASLWRPDSGFRFKLGHVAAFTLVVVFAVPSPAVDTLSAGVEPLGLWQSSDGVVSVVRAGDNTQMRLDNSYVLGDTESSVVEQMQAHVAFLPHPAPENVLFLGLGTGITAGAALNHDVTRLIAVELVPNVVRAAQEFFSGWTSGLFSDATAEVITDDARNFLLGRSTSFDIIVGDLFTPWHAGTGSLYTLEHFQLIRERLAAGGIFAQWLPLYQLTTEDFLTISRTFREVFPETLVWRADFSSTKPSIALMGFRDAAFLDDDVLRTNVGHIVSEVPQTGEPHMAGLFYLGDLSSISSRLDQAPINTDDRRTVEFGSPMRSQRANSGMGSYLVRDQFLELVEELATKEPGRHDPLEALPPGERIYVTIGRAYQRYLHLTESGQDLEAEAVRQSIETLSPDFLRR